MVAINVAYSAPLNPSSTQQPALTRSQAWQGLRIKVRKAYLFVSAIKICEVIEDHEAADGASGTVIRDVAFAAQPEKAVRETVKLFGPSRVDFHQPDGSIISNIVSDGPSGHETDLWMTYAFTWLHPDIDASDAAKIDEMTTKHKAIAKMAVDKSIEAIRRLVADGTIST